MARDVTVKISRLANNLGQCSVDPIKFETTPGSTVTFEFLFDAPGRQVVFEGPAPFDSEPGMDPGKFTHGRGHKVRKVERRETFSYKVVWSGGVGSGDGQGEVIPG